MIAGGMVDAVVVAPAGAALTVGDARGTAGPAVSIDGGATWSDLAAASLPFGEIAGLIAAGDGMHYVETTTHGVFRSAGADWTTYTRMRAPGGLRNPQAWLGEPSDTFRLAAILNADRRLLVTVCPAGSGLVIARNLGDAAGSDLSPSSAPPHVGRTAGG